MEVDFNKLKDDGIIWEEVSPNVTGVAGSSATVAGVMISVYNMSPVSENWCVTCSAVTMYANTGVSDLDKAKVMAPYLVLAALEYETNKLSETIEKLREALENV